MRDEDAFKAFGHTRARPVVASGPRGVVSASFTISRETEDAGDDDGCKLSTDVEAGTIRADETERPEDEGHEKHNHEHNSSGVNNRVDEKSCRPLGVGWVEVAE